MWAGVSVELFSGGGERGYEGPTAILVCWVHRPYREFRGGRYIGGGLGLELEVRWLCDLRCE